MRKRITLSLGLALLTAAMPAQAQPPSPATSPEPALGDPMPDRILTLEDGRLIGDETRQP